MAGDAHGRSQRTMTLREKAIQLRRLTPVAPADPRQARSAAAVTRVKPRRKPTPTSRGPHASRAPRRWLLPGASWRSTSRRHPHHRRLAGMWARLGTGRPCLHQRPTRTQRRARTRRIPSRLRVRARCGPRVATARDRALGTGDVPLALASVRGLQHRRRRVSRACSRG